MVYFVEYVHINSESAEFSHKSSSPFLALKITIYIYYICKWFSLIMCFFFASEMPENIITFWPSFDFKVILCLCLNVL